MNQRKKRLSILNEIYNIQKDYKSKPEKEQDKLDVQLKKLGRELEKCSRIRKYRKQQILKVKAN